MSVWKRLTNVAKGTVKSTVKSWTGEGTTPGEAALEAELEALGRSGDAGGDGPRQETRGRPSTQARPAVRHAHVDPARNPVKRTDLFPSEAARAPTADPKKDLLPDTEPADLAPEAPEDRVDAPLAEAASRVMDAVDDVLESAPDPFAAFESSDWDLLPADDAPGESAAATEEPVQEPLDAEEVDPDEVGDEAPRRTL